MKGSFMTQQAQRFEQQLTKTVHLDYLLHLPSAYDAEPEKTWPLMLFLHGAGERGSDLERVKVHGIPKIVEEQPDFPCIAVSPQCPVNTAWSVETAALDALLREVVHRYRVDEDRVYLTGLSMGGYGSWQFATEHPDRFAAVAPICGGSMWFANLPGRMHVLKDVPIWVFHGVEDEVVPLSESERLVDALAGHGGNVRFTVYPGVGHDSWTQTYANPKLYSWLFSHTRGKRAPHQPACGDYATGLP